MRQVIIAILTVTLLTCGCPGYLSDASASWWLRASTYHLFHANVFHLAVNCLAVWTVFRPAPWRRNQWADLILGYIVATLMYCTAMSPVVGMSNILFAVFGMRTPGFRSPWWRKGEVDLFFALTFASVLIPGISAVTHITSLLLGILIAEARRRLKSVDDDYRRANR